MQRAGERVWGDAPCCRVRETGGGQVRGGDVPGLPGPSHLPQAPHLPKGPDHIAGLRGSRVQDAPPPSWAVSSRGGLGGSQKRGRKRGCDETSLMGFPGLQRHLAYQHPGDPSKDDLGDVRKRMTGVTSGIQTCHFN